MARDKIHEQDPDTSGDPLIAQLRLYRSFLAGQLARWLNDQGLSPRSKRQKTRFTKATVMDMLGNAFYTGSVTYKGQRLPGKHPAVITEELFELVTSVRSRRRKLSNAVKTAPAHVYLLRSIGRCAACGGLLTCNGNASSKRYRDASRDKLADCSARKASVTAQVVEQQVGLLIRKMSVAPALRDAAFTAVSGDANRISFGAIGIAREQGRARVANRGWGQPRQRWAWAAGIGTLLVGIAAFAAFVADLI